MIIAEPVTTALKTQFPLSPRKYTKKMIEKSILFIFTSVVLGGVLAVIIGLIIKVDTNIVSQLVWLGISSFVLAFVLQVMAYSWYVRRYISSYYYDDEVDFLTIRKGVFIPLEIHVQYLKIQDVYVDQDILDRILGIYDVHISSATYSSGVAAHIDGVSKETASGLKNMLLSKIKSAYTGTNNPASPIQGNTMPQEGVPEHSQSDIQVPVQTNAPVKFNTTLSKEELGLSHEWWLAESVKVALASIFLPPIVTLWIATGIFEGNIAIDKVFWIWLIVLVISLLYRFGYLWLWQMHYEYNFGEEYIYLKEGVLSVSEKNMSYNTIQDVTVRQTIVDRIFGIADVVIENASANQIPAMANKKMGQATSNGIVIEGLSLKEAQHIVSELKGVIGRRSSLQRNFL
ncbi:MAG: hypothetical protein RIQ72_131 [Candidatus Parcubacteria bacterium]|jgi:putative membrane protein